MKFLTPISRATTSAGPQSAPAESGECVASGLIVAVGELALNPCELAGVPELDGAGDPHAARDTSIPIQIPALRSQLFTKPSPVCGVGATFPRETRWCTVVRPPALVCFR